MTARETVDQLKKRGHYRINFRPLTFNESALTLAQCKEFVEQNRVSLRGWDYPHFPSKDDGLVVGENYYEGWTNWAGYKELWRLYQSEQFLFLRGLREDWADESIFQDQDIEALSSLSVIGSLVYELAEACEFLARLRRAGLYSSGVQLQIALVNVRERQLVIRDRRRMPLVREYKATLESIVFRKTLSAEEVIVGSPALAIESIRFILDRFGWHDPSEELVDNEVAEYLQRRR